MLSGCVAFCRVVFALALCVFVFVSVVLFVVVVLQSSRSICIGFKSNGIGFTILPNKGLADISNIIHDIINTKT